MKYWSAFLLLAFAGPLCAEYLDTSELTVKQISMQANGGLMLQTEPRHSIDGLNCQSNEWLTLDSDATGFEPLLSLLMAAQMTQKSISVRAVDDSDAVHCRLEMVSLVEE